MRKKNFLAELSTKLGDMNPSEKNDILEYYDELIEDTIDKTGKYEEEVVNELGSIDDIVKRVNPKNKVEEKTSEDNKIRYDECVGARFEEETKESYEKEERQYERKQSQYERKEVKTEEDNYEKNDAVTNSTTNKARESETRRRKASNDRLALVIVIGVVTFPLWFGLLMGIIGVIIGISCAGFGVGIAGVVLIVHAIATFASGAAMAAFELGLGLALIGLGLIFAPLVVKFLTWIINVVCKGVKKFINNNKGGYCYEN